MNEKLIVAQGILDSARSEFSKAEMNAREALKKVLEPAGEHGVSLSPLEYIDDTYVPLNETEPQKFFPITLIRYWNGRLEGYVSEVEESDDGVRVLADGEWIDYERLCTDTWFILDCLEYNLEYADGYDD